MNLAPVEFGERGQHGLWKSSVINPDLGGFIDQGGPDAAQVFSGFGDDFWIDMVGKIATVDQVSVILRVNLVGGKPGKFTLVLARENGALTARITNVDLGPDAARVAPALPEFYSRALAPWLAEAGARYVGDPGVIGGMSPGAGRHGVGSIREP